MTETERQTTPRHTINRTAGIAEAVALMAGAIGVLKASREGDVIKVASFLALTAAVALHSLSTARQQNGHLARNGQKPSATLFRSRG